MPSSSIPRVKAALVELLEQQSWPLSTPADTVPTVCYGAPRDMPREAVIVGDTTQTDQTWFTFAPNRRESYEVSCAVAVVRPGDSQRQSTERAFELLAVVESALRDNPMLIGETHVVRISGPDLSEGQSDEGYVALVEFSLLVEGHI